MMDLFRNLLLNESEKTAQKEANYAIAAINDVYKEWKKVKRRVNAVDLVTTSINKVAKIHPSIIPYMHDTAKIKLAIILMRCMDMPAVKDIEAKKSTYKKLFPVLSALQSYSPNTGTGGNLREIVMTRLSTAVTHENDKQNKVFVAYEPTISAKYLDYLFGETKPQKVYKMQSLSLPEDFDTLVDILRINYKKAADQFKRTNPSKN